MDITGILEAIDAEIARLQEAGRLLGNTSAPIKAVKAVKTGKKKRTMSPEGRARIAAAQKARWAKQKGKKAA